MRWMRTKERGLKPHKGNRATTSYCGRRHDCANSRTHQTNPSTPVSDGYYSRLRGYHIPFELSPDEAAAFAQFVERVDYDTCTLFASKYVSYSSRAEADVMWSAVGMAQGQLAEAGFAPR